jgi:hypothetical protein
MNNEFLKKYQINVIDRNKRCAKYRPLDLKFFTDAMDKDIVQQHLSYDTEALLTVDIPQSQLERLEKIDHALFKKQENYGNLLEVIFEQKSQEKRIRNANLAVKQAYEQYSLLLHLAGYQDKTGLD